MRSITSEEVALVSGAGQFGCEFVGIKDIGAFAGGTGALGSTFGAMMTGASAGAAAWGIIAGAVTTSALVGYNLGTAISHGLGNCSGSSSKGGSE